MLRLLLLLRLESHCEGVVRSVTCRLSDESLLLLLSLELLLVEVRLLLSGLLSGELFLLSLILRGKGRRDEERKRSASEEEEQVERQRRTCIWRYCC